MNLMFNYFINRLRKFVSIFLTVTILSFSFFSKTFSSENVFTVDNIEVTGNFDTNFSREKYINKAFLDSFKILMSKILLFEDLNKLNDIKLNQVKVLVNPYSKNVKYIGIVKINSSWAFCIEVIITDILIELWNC